MYAIMDREIKAYFQSPLGYIFVGVMFLFTGYFFYAYNLYGNTTDMRGVFSMLFTVTLFLVPILTMRLMSEDRKLRTDQLLLTAPVSHSAVVLGKYFAASLVFLLSIMGTMIASAILSTLGKPEWPVIFGHFVGILLFGATLISICLFLSSLTESQVIAAVCGFAVSFLLILIDTLTPAVNNPILNKVLTELSFKGHYASFTYGILDFADIVFFLSVSAVFLVFTILVMDKRSS